MKIIGYRLDAKYNDGKVVSTEKYLTVIECCGMEIRKYSNGWGDKKRGRENDYKLYLYSSHPSLNFCVIGGGRRKDGCYKWLTREQAEEIAERAAREDTIDLRQFGEYQIFSEGHIQSVMIMNEYDDIDDEPIPIIVKASKSE